MPKHSVSPLFSLPHESSCATLSASLGRLTRFPNFFLCVLRDLCVSSLPRVQSRAHESSVELPIAEQVIRHPLALQKHLDQSRRCLLYTSDAADDLLCVDLG